MTALQNETVIIALVLIFLYLVIYRRNKLMANIGFMGVGIAVMSLSMGNIDTAMGLIILLASFVNTIYDILLIK